MAVAYEGGVILGADSRTSTGSYVANKVSDKIVPLTDNVWMCRSGSAADTQAIASHIVHYLDQHVLDRGAPATVSAAANLVMQMAYANKDMLQAGMIVAGWDKAKGGQVYSVPIGGALLQREYAIGGARARRGRLLFFLLRPRRLALSAPAALAPQALARPTSTASATRTSSRT